MKEKDLLRAMEKGILQWYDFKERAKVLFLGRTGDSLLELLYEKELQVVCCDPEYVNNNDCIQKNEEQFDYIIAIQILETQSDPIQYLNKLGSMLKSDGKLLMGVNNRLGIKYFCGDRDLYTNRSFDGIENYRRAQSLFSDTRRGRMYDLAQLNDIFDSTCLEFRKQYSVFPDLQRPQLIYAENYIPNEDLSNRYFPMYNYPDTVFLEEEYLYDGLIKNGLFHKMANAFLFECAKEDFISSIQHVTLTTNRGKEDALYTVILDNCRVEKHAIYSEGKKRIQHLYDNQQELRDKGIPVVECTVNDGVLCMPFIKAETAQKYLRNLIFKNEELFVQEMDRFRDIILNSSETVQADCGNGMGPILSKGYLDLTPLNCLYVDGEYVFFDQEFYIENCPANVIIARMVSLVYMGNLEMNSQIPIEFFYERYGLQEKIRELNGIAYEFTLKLRNEDELRVFTELHHKNLDVINSNRQRMNFSTNEYRRLFEQIFDDLDRKKLVLFGSGNFAKHFIALYGKKYRPTLILDNNPSKCGEYVENIPIISLREFTQLNMDEYKVIICIKNYLDVLEQLKNVGVSNMGIYDPNMTYSFRHKNDVCIKDNAETSPKKYHIGYVAGVFDLFHVGHVNLLRRAKEQCDYLIVGIVSDEGVYRIKEHYPVISEDDRAEVVRSCRYADQVEVLPTDYAGIRDAYKMFHFDCQFSGDDHGENPDWLADQQFLEKQGADIVFFPYTEKTSSTKIREQIKK